MAYLPWQFPDKWGYLNNPRWLPETGQPFMNRRAGDPPGYEEERHIPCGHWHKRGVTQEGGSGTEATPTEEPQIWEY